ncbi:MAG: exonuclease SbcCD subunit D [Bacteroidales bacterium]|nr:exonuclease SbcCD subunit D [Bacteroidales bacterium]
MKILHTADWHLGKRLDYYSRFEEQKLVMQEIIQIANHHNVDAVLIAGDLFDNFNPPIEAIELFYTTLKELTNNGKRPVIAIAGNHDSPDRIQSPDSLALLNGILFSGNPFHIINKLTIENGFSITKTDNGFIELALTNGELLRIIHTPFVNQQRIKIFIDKENDESISTFLHTHWSTLADKYCNNEGVNILLTHALLPFDKNETITEPDNEKPIEFISEILSAEIIPHQIDYVALGHLHRYQTNKTEHCTIAYSGSPVAYSFSEASQQKKIIIIEKTANTALTLTPITIENGKELKRKTFNSFDDAILWLKDNQEFLVECTIKTDTYFKPGDLKELHDIHKGIISILPFIENTENNDNTNTKKNIDLSKSRQELFIDYFRYKFAKEPNKEILSLYKEIESLS